MLCGTCCLLGFSICTGDKEGGWQQTAHIDVWGATSSQNALLFREKVFPCFFSYFLFSFTTGEPAEWSERLTSRQGGLARRCRRSINIPAAFSTFFSFSSFSLLKMIFLSPGGTCSGIKWKKFSLFHYPLVLQYSDRQTKTSFFVTLSFVEKPIFRQKKRPWPGFAVKILALACLSYFFFFFSCPVLVLKSMSTVPLPGDLQLSSRRRRSGQSVTASNFGSNGPRFESDRGRCVESLDKALYSHCPKEKPSH